MHNNQLYYNCCNAGGDKLMEESIGIRFEPCSWDLVLNRREKTYCLYGGNGSEPVQHLLEVFGDLFLEPLSVEGFG